MLTAYLQTVRRIMLNDQRFERVNNFDLVDWVNIARGQVAAESECIRVYSTLAVDDTAQQYPFSAVVFPAGTAGVAVVQAVRDITWQVAGGRKKVYSREWEWFNRYVLSTPVPVAGSPKHWAQYGQGTQGTLFLNLLDTSYSLFLDTVCLPSSLNSDADPEALPGLWTDAVPYFAAYMGFLQQGDNARSDSMMKLYGVFMQRARDGATPSELPHQFAGVPDPTVGNKLGIQQRRTAA